MTDKQPKDLHMHPEIMQEIIQLPISIVILLPFDVKVKNEYFVAIKEKF